MEQEEHIMNNLASPLHRFLAWIIDTLISFGITALLVMTIAQTTRIEDFLQALLHGLIAGLVLAIAHPVIQLLLISYAGGSIGKLVSGLTIVDQNGTFLTLPMAFFRSIVGYMVSGSFLWLGFLWIFVDAQRRAWHDMIAGSYVVQKSANGIATGLFALVFLLGFHGYVWFQIVGLVVRNAPLYQQAVESISKELDASQFLEKQLKDSVDPVDKSTRIDTRLDRQIYTQ